MNELIRIDNDNKVSGRELHEFLEVGTDYRHWIDRMLEYGFTQGADFNMVKNDRVQAEGNRKVKRMVDDVVMTTEMAKEICMLQRTDRGKQARQYFIQVENDWNSPDKIMARALVMSQKLLDTTRLETDQIDFDSVTGKIYRFFSAVNRTLRFWNLNRCALSQDLKRSLFKLFTVS